MGFFIHFRQPDVTVDDIVKMIVKALENDEAYPDYDFNHPAFENKPARTRDVEEHEQYSLPFISSRRLHGTNSIKVDSKFLNKLLSQNFGQRQRHK